MAYDQQNWAAGAVGGTPLSADRLNHLEAGVFSAADVADAAMAAVDALVAGAPGALDTLNELAAALGDDANFAATVTNSLATKLTFVSHGAVAGTARPAVGAGVVLWLGSVAPANVAAGDLWVDTAGKLIKRWTGAAFDSFGVTLEAATAPPDTNVVGGVLGAAGTAARSDHTHRVGDHDHSAAGKGAKLNQANTHQLPDTDAAAGSLHHTIGAGATQAAAGNHVHAGSAFHGARVSNSVDNVIATGGQVVTFDTEQIDTDGYHSVAANTSRMTIPAGLAGKYMIIGMAEFLANASGIRQTGIYKNGVAAAWGSGQVGSTSNTSSMVATILDLAVGDFVELFAFQNSGGNLNVQHIGGGADTRLEIHYLGA